MGYGALGRCSEGCGRGSSPGGSLGPGGGLVPASPHLPVKKLGLGEERQLACGARLRGEGLGLELPCPLVCSWFCLVCISAGRAEKASWCYGDLWKMKRRQWKEGRVKPSQGEGAWSLEACGPQGPARV